MKGQANCNNQKIDLASIKDPSVFHTKLPNYTLKSILLRIVTNSMVAIMVMQIMHFVAQPQPHIPNPGLYQYLSLIFFFNALAESIILTDYILEYFYPVPYKIKTRFILGSISAIVFIVIIINLLFTIHSEYQNIPKNTFYLGVTFGLMFSFLLSIGLTVSRITEKWVASQKEIEVMKQEKLKMDYNLLQDKLNPHFLFNNLSVLKSLIMYDTDTAIKFTENFTDVYRYVLKSKDKKTVPLKKELEFTQSYIALHKERVGEGFIPQINIEEEYLSREIIPLTLQLLVENAIKHNITGKKSPLTLTITILDNYLIVSNNLQPKESSYSTYTGLNTLTQSYKLLTQQNVIIEQSMDDFTVKIPLL